MKGRAFSEVQGKPAFEQLEVRILLSGTDTAIELFNVSPAKRVILDRIHLFC